MPLLAAYGPVALNLSTSQNPSVGNFIFIYNLAICVRGARTLWFFEGFSYRYISENSFR